MHPSHPFQGTWLVCHSFSTLINFDFLSHHTPSEVHDIVKSQRIIILFCIFYGELCHFQELHKKALNHFIHFKSSHFLLTVKIHVTLGT